MANVSSFRFQEYLPFLVGLLMVAGFSFVDDIHSLPDSLRMVVQIVSILLMFWSINLGSGGMVQGSWFWQVVIALVALFFCVGPPISLTSWMALTVLLQLTDLQCCCPSHNAA